MEFLKLLGVLVGVVVLLLFVKEYSKARAARLARERGDYSGPATPRAPTKRHQPRSADSVLRVPEIRTHSVPEILPTLA